MKIINELLVPVENTPLKMNFYTLQYDTKERNEFINITEDIRGIIKTSLIKFGLCFVNILHTTCSLPVNELDEPCLVNDLKKYLLDKTALPDNKTKNNSCVLKNPGATTIKLEDIGDEALQKLYNRYMYLHDSPLRTVNKCAGECDNGHSHIQASLWPNSQFFQIFNGQLILGTWQKICLVEHDHARTRQIALLIFGV